MSLIIKQEYLLTKKKKTIYLEYYFGKHRNKMQPNNKIDLITHGMIDYALKLVKMIKYL